MARQPDTRRISHKPQIQGIPAEKAQHKAEQHTDQGKHRGKGALAQTVQMGADAGTGNSHAQPEQPRAQRQHQTHRADMGIRRQPPAKRIGHKGAQHRMVTEGADGQRRQQAEQPVGVAALQIVPGNAEETETRTLQQHTKHGPGQQRKTQRPSRRGRFEYHPGPGHHPDSQRQRQKQNTGARPVSCYGFTHSQNTPVANTKGRGIRPAHELPRRGQPRPVVYLPPHTVPATFTTGTPTALPYSVQEPS